MLVGRAGRREESESANDAHVINRCVVALSLARRPEWMGERERVDSIDNDEADDDLASCCRDDDPTVLVAPVFVGTMFSQLCMMRLNGGYCSVRVNEAREGYALTNHSSQLNYGILW